MNAKIAKVLADPKTFTIKGVEVKIYPADYEDTLRMVQLKKEVGGKIDLTNQDNIKILDLIMRKKLKQSLTDEVNGVKVVPTDEEISGINSDFYSEFMTKWFELVSGDSGGEKKK